MPHSHFYSIPSSSILSESLEAASIRYAFRPLMILPLSSGLFSIHSGHGNRSFLLALPPADLSELLQKQSQYSAKALDFGSGMPYDDHTTLLSTITL